MGIRGIYKEIGSGRRVSLTKLAVDTLEETGRPLRLAIDISIWQFQTQAARGGTNPAIRTLFYRLLRLLGLSIQPIFVFDGPNKPAFKRNKRSGRGDGVASSMAKRLIKLFGFLTHDAPGEAEAECAFLQQTGVVDAVLSEDVDTIMFGSTCTLRNWSSEGVKGKTPTHVSVYDTDYLREGGSGLDREGMVLVALMSGGDYLPEGIPGAGIKVACEAARASFGKWLCKLKRADVSELASWKEWLAFELQHNESQFFKRRHKALSIPEDFPNLEVLGYYTHPVVSPDAVVDRLRSQDWDMPVDVQGLRDFARDTFNWSYRIGAIKFIKVLAPCLLVRKMISRRELPDNGEKPVELLEKEESELVKAIKTRRAHASTDGTPELRVSFIPTQIVGYDFQDEPDEVVEYGRSGIALNSDDEFEDAAGDDGAESIARGASKKPFDPTEPDLFWIPETVAKLGIPVMVEDWEESERAKVASRRKPAAAKRKAKAKGDAGKGAAAATLDQITRVTKNIPQGGDFGKDVARRPSPVRLCDPLCVSAVPSQSLLLLPSPIQASQKTRATRSSKQSKPKPARRASPASRPDASTNPWTIAGSQVSPRVTRLAKAAEAIIISSSPPASPPADRRAPVARGPGTPGAGDASPPRSASRSPPPSSPPKHRSVSPARSPTRGGEEDEGASRPPRTRRRGTPPQPSEKKRPPRGAGTPDRAREDSAVFEEDAAAPAGPTTRMYVLSRGAPGFVREVEVAAAEADALLAERAAAGGARKEGRGRSRAVLTTTTTVAVWKCSDVACIDLTDAN